MKLVDLRFSYHSAEPVTVWKDHGISEDQRGMVIEVLSRHFQRKEPGAFVFDWLDPATLTPLQRVRREGGEPTPAEAVRLLAVSLSTTRNPIGTLSEGERREVLVRDIAGVLINECARLAESGVLFSGPSGGALSEQDRCELIDHLLRLNLDDPESPGDKDMMIAHGVRAKLRARMGREPTDQEWRGEMERVYLGSSLRPVPIAAPIPPVPLVDPSAPTDAKPVPHDERAQSVTTDQAAWPTLGEMASEAGISDDTFRRIRDAAGLELALRGGNAQHYRYSPSEVSKLVAAVRAGSNMERVKIIEKWKRWTRNEAATKPQGRNEAAR